MGLGRNPTALFELAIGTSVERAKLGNAVLFLPSSALRLKAHLRINNPSTTLSMALVIPNLTPLYSIHK